MRIFTEDTIINSAKILTTKNKNKKRWNLSKPIQDHFLLADL